VHISARSDHAIRAALELACREPEIVTAETIAAAQDVPRRSVVAILSDLRRADLVRASRGSTGGYVLTRPAREITLGDVVRGVDGPAADVVGARADGAGCTDVTQHLPGVWAALRTSLRQVLDATTLHDVLTGDLPDHVRRLAEAPEV